MTSLFIRVRKLRDNLSRQKQLAFSKPYPFAVSVCLMLVLSICGPAKGEGSLAELQDDRSAAQRRLKKAEDDLAKLTEKASGKRDEVEEAVELADFVDAATQEKSELLATADEAEANVRRLMQLLNSYRKLGAAETDIVAGAELGDITLPGGRELEGAVVSRVESGSIGLRHSAGAGTFAIDQLPEEIARRFMIPPASAFPKAGADIRKTLASRPRDTAAGGATGEKTITKASAGTKSSAAKSQEQAAKNQRRQAFDKEKDELAAKVSEAETKRKAADVALVMERQAMYAKQRELNSGSKTKRSASDQKRILSPYEQRIAAYQKTVEHWSAEIGKLHQRQKELSRKRP